MTKWIATLLGVILTVKAVNGQRSELDYTDNDNNVIDMGQNEDVRPPDFNSNPFPNQPGFDPFSRKNQFNGGVIDQFRNPAPPSTEDPFRRPPPITEDPFRMPPPSTEDPFRNNNNNNGKT
jgi:hypothetical protein